MATMTGMQAEMHDKMVSEVRRFVDKEVMPVASELEHANEFPTALVEQMKEMGIFAATVPAEYGGLGLPMVTYAAIVEELSRGWMSLGGVVNTHAMGCYMIASFGTQEQKERFLPDMALGVKRAGFCITEPNAGSDVQAIQGYAVKQGDGYIMNANKMFVTNGRRAEMFMVLVKTDRSADPPYRGMSAFIIERSETPSMKVGRDIDKLGYKGVDTTELTFEDSPVPSANLLGGEEGRGFVHMMSGLEVGRINTAARAVGVSQAAFEDSIRYAQQRYTFGQPIAEHQAIQLKLADMATKIKAARLLTRDAAEVKDRGQRADMEAGMAKLFATETALEVSLEAVRIHGGYGYTKDMRVERYYRDAPFMAIAEGTNEIQRTIIARNLLRQYPI